jgi:hypothetical protein
VFFFRASKYYPDASQLQFEGLLLPAWRFVMSGVLFQGVKVLPDASQLQFEGLLLPAWRTCHIYS